MKLPHAQHLSAEELAGQVLMPALHLNFVNRNAPATRRILQLLERFHVGGFVLFGGQPADVKYWIEMLQQQANFPLFFAADLERGLGSVFSHGTLFPHALAFGAGEGGQLIQDAAEVIAREARAVGINVLFGPVLDLANHPKNPVINIRAWHSDPEIVADYGQVFTEVLQKYGIACVGKHFPGHGATELDSHTQLPVLEKDWKELEKSDLVPFHKAVESHIKGLMAGHLVVSRYSYPASMESELVQKILRDSWKFSGVVFTDALEMAAIRNYYSPWEQAFLPLEAGLDVLLMPEKLSLIYHLLRERINTDTEFRRFVERAVQRIFSLKKWIHSHEPAQAHPLRIYKIVEHPNHIGVARQVAEKSITLLFRSKKFPLKLPAISRVHHVVFTDTVFREPPLKVFQEKLGQFFENVSVYYHPSLKCVKASKIHADAVVIVSLYFRTFAGNVQEMDWELVKKVIHHFRKYKVPILLFWFGNPFQLNNLGTDGLVDAVFLCYSYVDVSQEAAFKALCSFVEVGGRLPISLESPFNNCMHIPAHNYKLQTVILKQGWTDVEAFIQKAIYRRYFPGCSLLIARGGKILFHEGFGHFDYEKGAPSVNKDTIYDLASLTKVLATTPAIMKLFESQQISLSDTLIDFYPMLKKDKKIDVTIADLLAHQGGLPAWKPFYESCSNRQEIVTQILETPLEYLPGSQSLYSDLGFILLYDIIERITGIEFAVFCRDGLFQPLELSTLQFNPSTGQQHKIPPTGYDPFRGDIVQGSVNDANCYVMGGVSGHSGLFGNTADVAAIGQLFLQKGIYNRRRMFRRSTIEFFSRPFNHTISSRALGWDTPGKKSSCGRYFSQESIGHTGFTGTSLWVDLRREIIVVFLSNRVHPDPQRNRMGEFRPQLHDLIMRVTLKKG